MDSRFLLYTTQEGDTWDAIALDFYNSEYKSSLLMGANPDHIKKVIFSSGVKLIIPVIEEDPAETLPPWKRGE